ncbi:hypothetical protein [Streptomyces ficellus]|uniref:Uncharacterized protein n=1 Tax=Streptomyces ficellus TaxID=1977088 RepID=A0A6I6F454_9ACTN|nr:hypothetical protein [Streptomyces ficellus]QGV77514.1 hypothetical protein EIZ62_04055 [Streptomyces ficellus]
MTADADAVLDVDGDFLAGAWTARVARPSGTSSSVLHFTVDGRVFLASGGAGTWWPTGARAFSFRVAEPVFDARGDCAGWVDVEQRAVLTGDGGGFRGEGTSVVYGADGARLRVSRVEISARPLRPGVPPP